MTMNIDHYIGWLADGRLGAVRFFAAAALAKTHRTQAFTSPIRPLVDRNGQLIYSLGVQYDVTMQVGANAEIDRLRLQLGDVQR